MYNGSMSDHGPIDPERMYSLKEIAGVFNVSERTVSRWISEKKLKAYVLGSTIRIYGKDILSAAQAAKARVQRAKKPAQEGPKTPPRARRRSAA